MELRKWANGKGQTVTFTGKEAERLLEELQTDKANFLVGEGNEVAIEMEEKEVKTHGTTT